MPFASCHRSVSTAGRRMAAARRPQSKNRLEGSYATSEAAFKAVILAASNDIKRLSSLPHPASPPRAERPDNS